VSTRLTVAAFDLDGTITSRDCVVPFIRGVAGTPQLALKMASRPVALGRAAVGRDRDALKAAAARAAFAGRHHADVEHLADAFARQVHDEWLRDDTLSSLRRHQLAGDDVVIVSASFEIYVRPLARLLGIEHVMATRLATDGRGVLTGGLEGPNCRGPEKVRRLHLWLDDHHQGRHNVELVAYGDSAGDRELLTDADVSHWVEPC
jgi:phosphatidylglycerophosphatase C